ncbi:hypothetical protein GN956_G12609 [Arapaima gigas]
MGFSLCFFLFRKWRKGLQLALRDLPSNKWKAVLCLAQIGLALLALLIYSLNNVFYSFLTSIFVSQYHYAYSVTLTFAQVLLTLLLFLSLRFVGVAPQLSYSLQLGEQLLVPSVCESIQEILALWAETSAPVALYHITLQLLPLACVAWSRVLKLTQPSSPHITVLLAAITVTSVSITVSRGPLWVEPLVCVYAPLSLFLHSLSLCWMAKVGEDEVAHKGWWVSLLNLYFSLTVNKSLVLGVLCLVHPDGLRALTTGHWQTLLFLAYLLGVLLLGALQHLLLGMGALFGFPLAAALLHAAPELVKPLMALL